MEYIIPILLVCAGGLGGAGGYHLVKRIKIKSTDKKTEDILNQAKKDSEKLKREALFEAKEEAHRLKIETEKEINERKKEVKKTEDRLIQREDNMDKRDELFQKREISISDKEKNLLLKQEEIQEKQVEVEKIKEDQITELSKITGLDKKEAKELIMKRVEEDMNHEVAIYIKERIDAASLDADKTVKEILVKSMQRYAADVANEQTVTVVSLPTDEMKGRIIGREGRNIRTLEAITGVDLIIDDTPEAVVLSSFDPLRREVARITLETLIKDGRIHPSRIEEVYDKVSKDINKEIVDYGNNALFELGITKMDPALVKLLGRLHFRTSYGQNALRHSMEVAHLSGLLAAELGINAGLAKRAGLLHDIGKAVDHEVEGSHVTIGVELAKKYGESEIVINSIASHHGDVIVSHIISSIVAVADALSASRPGARNDSLENYLKRLADLEDIANQIEGVDKTFAVQAGRELRVMVKPEKIDDNNAYKIARDIKTKIEDTMQYPGTITVTVIRETRVQEEAK